MRYISDVAIEQNNKIRERAAKKVREKVVIRFLDSINFFDEFDEAVKESFDETENGLKDQWPEIYDEALKYFTDECFEELREYI